MKAARGVDAGCSPGWDRRGANGNSGNSKCGGDHRRRITGRYAEDKSLQGTRGGPAAQDAKPDSKQGETQRVEAGPANDCGAARTKGEA
jgi:hypothetical protein